MRVLSDLRILYHMLLKPVRGRDHAARLESFYGGQAEAYDSFRRRLLLGRAELYGEVPHTEQGVWVDLGGGTGSNLEFLGPRLESLRKVYLVDLSPSLLAVAGKRAQQRGWKNVEPVQADATTFQPAEGAADVVTFSYSLTMIPDWFAALENGARCSSRGASSAWSISSSPASTRKRAAKHSWFTRLLAALVRLRQRLPLLGPCAAAPPPLSAPKLRGKPGESPLHSADPSALLPIHRPPICVG